MELVFSILEHQAENPGEDQSSLFPTEEAERLEFEDPVRKRTFEDRFFNLKTNFSAVPGYSYY